LIGPLRGAAVYEVVGAMVQGRKGCPFAIMHELEDGRDLPVESRAGQAEKLDVTSNVRKQFSNGPKLPKTSRASPAECQLVGPRYDVLYSSSSDT
jgi:hypothetical protein